MNAARHLLAGLRSVAVTTSDPPHREKIKAQKRLVEQRTDAHQSEMLADEEAQRKIKPGTLHQGEETSDPAHSFYRLVDHALVPGVQSAASRLLDKLGITSGLLQGEKMNTDVLPGLAQPPLRPLLGDDLAPKVLTARDHLLNDQRSVAMTTGGHLQREKPNAELLPEQRKDTHHEGAVRDDRRPQKTLLPAAEK